MKTTKQFLTIIYSVSAAGRRNIMRGCLFTVCAFCLALTTNAQVSFGPLLGTNISNIGGTETDGNGLKVGYHMGVVVDIAVGDHFAYETGVEYSAKGTQAKEESALKWNLNYIEIPFMAKGKFDSGFNMFAGPYLGILMTSEVTNGDKDVDVKESTCSTDAGVKFGVGFQLKSGLAFSAHYVIGCVDLNKTKEVIGSSYNRVYGLSIAYMFGGK